jgi:hypothetical protein
MKKNLFFVILILFVLSTSAFAGFSDPKKESEKPTASNPKENRLTNEELNRLTRRAEIDNLSKASVSNKDNSGSTNNLRATNQVIVESGRHHHGYYLYGGGSLLLIVLLVIILV